MSRLPALTSIRFFAALFVVLYHTAGMGVPGLDHTIVGRIVGLGHVSVGFFFVLSGYILTTVYSGDAKPFDKKRFFVARFARIYPLFFATLLLDIPNLYLERLAKYGVGAALQKTSLTLLGNMFLLQAWLPKLRGLDNPNWSISAESFYYLIFPFAAFHLARMSRSTAMWCAIGAYSIGMGATVIGPELSVTGDILKFNPVFHLHEFLVGVALARLKPANEPNTNARIFLLLALVCCALTALFSQKITHLMWNNGVLIPVYCWLIVTLTVPVAPMTKLLSLPALELLGESSYSVYLIHIPLWQYFVRLGGSGRPVLYVCYLLVVLIGSILTYRYFELPARQWLNRRLGGSSHATGSKEVPPASGICFESPTGSEAKVVHVAAD